MTNQNFKIFQVNHHRINRVIEISYFWPSTESLDGELKLVSRSY
jgi:hypothetical protein